MSERISPPGTGELLAPFGLLWHAPEGSTLASFDASWLAEMAEQHGVLVLRGIAATDRVGLVRAARRLGPLLPWSFGAINELFVKPSTENYLYTDRSVPLHWDGAFVSTPPRFLFFHCLAAPPERAGGQTVFVDTRRVLAAATDEQRARWRFLRFRYATEKRAHYGGSFEASVLGHHPRTGVPVLRFAEPVDDLNPVRLEAVGLDPDRAAECLVELQAALRSPSAVLLHQWQDGDYVIADNLTLLHGRRPFTEDNRRHLRRVNVMLDDRSWRDTLKDSLRIRRPEFLIAEIPIALVPALLVAPDGKLVSWLSAKVAVLLVLLFHMGDMVNCLVDRDLDLVYKTRTAEAVWGLGPRNVWWQIVATVLLAVLLAVDVAVRTERLWVLPCVFVGLLLGWQYSDGPLKLKSRGILQIPALMGVLFVGPMVLATVPWVQMPPPWLCGFIVAYAAMQQGIVLVNTAEDLREDREFNLHTSAIALGARGSLSVALLLVAAGGGAVLILLAGHAPDRVALQWLPLLAGLALALVAIARLWISARGSPDPEAIIRAGATWVPVWIAATAWGTLLVVWGL